MEKAESWDRKSVSSELNEGLELANKLQKQLHNSTYSREACEVLVGKIVCCYDNALSLLNCIHNGFTEAAHQDHVFAAVHKKRWREEVRVCSGTGFEFQFDDGYNWRKYGQKYILGNTHPRAYYRCTHRYTKGCLATKQVQQVEDDPSKLKVAYRGKHRCVVKQTKENVNIETSQRYSQQMMINIEPGLKVELNPENAETQFLSEPSSELYFSMSPSHSSDIRIDRSFLTSESYGAEITPNPIPTANLTNGDFDFLIDQVDFDSCLVEAAEYFSHPQG